MEETAKKKRAKPVTMTARSKKWLERQGYIVALVERTLWFPKKVNGMLTGEKFMQKFDCFGFADQVAVHPDRAGVTFVQTTTRDHQAERREKILGISYVVAILQAKNRIVVHGWAKGGARGARKLWSVAVHELFLTETGKPYFKEIEPVEVEDNGDEAETLFSERF